MSESGCSVKENGYGIFLTMKLGQFIALKKFV